MKQFIKNIKALPFLASMALNPINKVTDAHPGYTPNDNIVEQESRAHELKDKFSGAFTTCHEIIDSHQLCISNNSPQIDPYQIAGRFRQNLQKVYQTLKIPKTQQTSETDTTLLIITDSQAELKTLMQRINIQTYWGYFLEDLIPNTNVAFSYSDSKPLTPWENTAHELGHAIFNLTIGDHLEARDFCQKFKLNHKVIWEGFAEFFKYANNIKPKIKIKGIPQGYINQTFQFPDIYNPHFAKQKIYSITELLSYSPRPTADNYLYGKMFFAFLHYKQPVLFRLLLLSIRTKSDASMEYFLQKIKQPNINQEFQTYQRFYQHTHHALNTKLFKHVQSVYNEQKTNTNHHAN